MQMCCHSHIPCMHTPKERRRGHRYFSPIAEICKKGRGQLGIAIRAGFSAFLPPPSPPSLMGVYFLKGRCFEFGPKLLFSFAALNVYTKWEREGRVGRVTFLLFLKRNARCGSHVRSIWPPLLRSPCMCSFELQRYSIHLLARSPHLKAFALSLESARTSSRVDNKEIYVSLSLAPKYRQNAQIVDTGRKAQFCKFLSRKG